MTCWSINLYLIYTAIRKQFALLALDQGPRSKFSSGGAKEECVKENLGGGRGGHACGFLFNFSKVTENANNDKTIDFFPHLINFGAKNLTLNL